MSSYRMTRFSPGGLQELISISFPLMLTAFSGHFMAVCDRAILARYSIDVMAAVFVAGTAFAVFAFFGVTVAAIAEIFVGQYNGKKEFDKLAIPVWQMIWFSLLFALLAIPITMFGANWFLPQLLVKDGKIYFQILMLGSFLMPLSAAVSAFFIGQGRTKMVTAAAIISNVVNLMLDIILIHGIEGWIEPLGATGAAIATVVSMCIQFFILFVLFLGKENNKKYRTRKYSVDLSVFKECMKVGLPMAMSVMLEIAGWSALAIVLGNVNKDYVVAQSVSNSFFLLFAFFYDGLSKAIAAIASNFIGASHKSLIGRLLKSAVTIHFCIVLILFVLLIIKSQFTLGLLLDIRSMKESVKSIAFVAMRGTFYFFLADGIAWIIASVLRAGGDTKFVMFCNVICMWAAVFGSYTVLSNNPNNIQVILLYAMPSYAVANMIILFYRYWSNKWLRLKVGRFT